MRNAPYAVFVTTLISCGGVRSAASNLGWQSTAYAHVHSSGSVQLACHSIKPVVSSAVVLALCA